MGDDDGRSHADGAEAGTRSRMSYRLTHAPTRGPRPLVPPLRVGHPMKGEYPLQNPRSSPAFPRFVVRRASGGRRWYQTSR